MGGLQIFPPNPNFVHQQVRNIFSEQENVPFTHFLPVKCHMTALTRRLPLAKTDTIITTMSC